MIYDQGDDNACALFLFCRRCFWRGWTSGVVVFGPLLQEIDRCSGTFFIILLSFLVVCICIAARALRCCR
jgi:hypothetical protein